MRRVYLVTDGSRSSAVRFFRKSHPYVRVVAKVKTGFLGFESRDDYLSWRRQKVEVVHA